jgi:hypothetical protein
MCALKGTMLSEHYITLHYITLHVSPVIYTNVIDTLQCDRSYF